MYVTIGALKRLSTYMAGQLKNSVDITGGTISGVTQTGSTFSSANLAVNVTDGSTAANFSNNGLTKFGDDTTAAATYTMDAPTRAGIVKMLRSEQSDTLIRTVNTGVGINDSTTITKFTFDTNGEAVTLVAESTDAWSVVSNVGAVGTST
jgi:hypothetical protein